MVTACRVLLLVCLLCCATFSAAQFNFAYYVNSTSANGQLGGPNQSVAPLRSPLTLGGVTYPNGSFILWGGQLNTAVIPIVSSAAVGSVVPYIGSSSQQVGAEWSIGCAQRFGGNRFYTIGTFASISQNLTGDVYFVQASTDGVNWPNVLDTATTAAWRLRNNEDNTLCVVDLNNYVYSVGQEDTWRSTNLGVTFSKVALSGSRFSNRTFFAGGIYTVGSTDYIMVLGGRGAANTGDRYGYYDSNDVWQSTTGGATWTMLTAYAAWAPRDQFAWTRSSSTGLQVINGGAIESGYAGFFGDVWTSTDGVTWSLVVEMTSIGEQSMNEIIFDSNNYLYCFGGQTNPPQYTLVYFGAKSTVPLITSGSVAAVTNPFQFALYVNSTSANGQLGGPNQSVAPLLSPLTLGGATYPNGSFILWGGQLNTAVIPIVFNVAAGSVVPYIGPSSQQVGAEWSIGCAQRFGGNRFYTIGTFGSISQNLTGDVYFVQASTDGVNWPNVLDTATTAAWRLRNNEDNTLCVVDLNNYVYSVGQEDTWRSTNLGVTFSKVNLTSSRFSLRTFFAGGIYTVGSTDYIMVLGGRGAPNAQDAYGYYDSNDVWQSTTGGATWTMLTASAAWAPRDQFAWTRSSSTGLQVVNGGSVQGGWADYFGDVWTSTDGANWYIVAETTAIGVQSLNEIIFDSNNYLYFFGGQTNPPNYQLVYIGARSTAPLVLVTASFASQQSAPSGFIAFAILIVAAAVLM